MTAKLICSSANTSHSTASWRSTPKKITVEGKVTSRDGVNMIENGVIQK
jgi:hypothetical protein